MQVEQALDLLRSGEIELVGLMPRASNYTFAVRVASPDGEVLGVWKPMEGETPLWDFPEGTLWRREVAAWVVSDALGWDLVPPTVGREGPYGAGSLQLFVDADPAQHYFTLVGAHADSFRRLAAFDLVVNNADRKAGHCLLDRGTGRVWAIDHGVCFHEQPKLRTVIWDFASEPLPSDVVTRLRALETCLRAEEPPTSALRALLSEGEVAAMSRRVAALLASGRYPDPDEERRSYPWPPI